MDNCYFRCNFIAIIVVKAEFISTTVKNELNMKIILLIKIIVTTIFWAAPLLFGTPKFFSLFGIPFPHPVIFLRLLGMAYFSLVFIYYNGYKLLKIRRNAAASEIAISTGIVSNGLAFIVLFFAGTHGEWNSWGLYGQIYMWFSTALAFLLAVSLQITFKKNIL